MKQGWEIKRLSEIGKVYNGNSINEKIKKEKYTNLEDGLSFIATKDISYESEIDYDNGIKIPFEEKSLYKTAPKNTVLICAEGGSAGRKIGFTNKEVCFGNKLFALATNKNIESRYVYYYYFSSTFQKNFAVELAGIIGGVSMNKFKDLEIPLPPLPEQQHIVAILDEVFAAIAKAKANAEQNLKNAKELFESYLQAVFENKGENWERVKVDEVCESIIDCVNKTAPIVSEKTPYKMIRTTNIRFGLVDLSSVRYVTEKTYSDWTRRQKPIIGDILFTREAPMGEVGMLLSTDKVFLGQRIVSYRVDNSKVTGDFLLYAFQSKNLKNQIKKLASGATVQHLRVPHTKEFEFNIPPLTTQQTIVQKLDALSAETQKLAAIYQKKSADLDELKKSILQKAFNGELNTTRGG